MCRPRRLLPVIRYYAIATVLVVGVVIVIVALGAPRRPLELAKPGFSKSASPSPARAQAAGSAGGASAFTGDAPWVLAALPGCYEQVFSHRAPRAVLDAERPPSTALLPMQSGLVTGPCRLQRTASGAIVRRGTDRFRVPGVVALYIGRNPNHGDVIVVQRRDGAHEELREFALRLPSVLEAPGGARTTIVSRPAP